jgi:hypothetical protein
MPGRANVVRVMLSREVALAVGDADPEAVVLPEDDDLDPRLWPGVLTGLLDGGLLTGLAGTDLLGEGTPRIHPARAPRAQVQADQNDGCA